MIAHRERGLFLLPVVCFFAVALGAAFLLLPALNREDLLEAGRLREEQARAAAEGAAELARYRGEDVREVAIGRATAEADLLEDGSIRALGRVPGLRDAVVTVEIVVPSE